jgi:hypothetical protein
MAELGLLRRDWLGGWTAIDTSLVSSKLRDPLASIAQQRRWLPASGFKTEATNGT